MKFLAWLMSLFFAFNLGAESTKAPSASDDELKSRVQEHLDVIVDESAAIVDEVTESIRQDERVQHAEEVLQDAREIVEETRDELEQVGENTRNRVKEKFGTGEPAAEAPAEEAEDSETVPAAAETDEKAPAAEESEAVPAAEEAEGEKASEEEKPEEKTGEAAPEQNANQEEKNGVDVTVPPMETPAPGEPVNG